jgi:hypothetical protein
LRQVEARGLSQLGRSERSAGERDIVMWGAGR